MCSADVKTCTNLIKGKKMNNKQKQEKEEKALHITDVRQALIDFLQHMWETDFDRKGLAFDEYVDEYLKSINVA